ncbi:MAG: type II methionyl aminopeptidase [Candidatus Micrarchaeia archaeon]
MHGEKVNFLDEEQIKTAELVGKISYKMLELAKDKVKEGAKLLDVANEIERYAKDNGYDLAFPVNISINEYAAHYTPSAFDDKVFGKNDIVKIDLGAKKDGVLGDCAITIDISGENQKLVEASKEALDNAVSSIRAGVKISEIGKVVEETIKGKGFVPIMNLGGHGVGIHELHAEPFIPNYDNGDETELEEGMVVALEPFATNGKGYVVNSDIFEIYGYVDDALTRDQNARKMLAEVKSRYNHEPFAVRWLSDLFGSRFTLYSAIKELMRAGAIEPYPALVESGKGMVAQTEVEVLVEKDGCKVLTK